MSMSSRNEARRLFQVISTVVFVAALSASSLCAQQPAASPSAGSRFIQPDPIDFDDHEGWTQIFDGKTLNGWDGPSEVWHVEDGAIVGVSSDAHPSGTTN